ncbi:MAG: restriction endonuclease subunit S [Bacteroidetes bacterium]|nr:restriction endonuclease subunit S [Bacteroidota bacterium]
MLINTMKTKEKYKMSDLGLIPEDWEVLTGGQISEKITKGSSPNWQGFNYSSEGILFVTSENVRDGYLDISEPKYLPEAFNQKQKNSTLKNGDILINIVGASIGRSAIFDLKDRIANINQAVCLFRLKDGVSNKFISYFLQHPKCVELLISNQSETGRPNLTLEDIRNFKFILPPFPEQKKIASVLDTWDRTIEALGTLISAKEKLMSGLMQALLTGESKFKEFRKDRWKKIRFGSLAETYSGLSGKTAKDFGSGSPYVPYMNVFSNSRVNVSYFDYVNVEKGETQTKVQYGDILFTISSETPDEVGMTSVLLDNVKELYLNSFCFGVRLNDFKTLHPEFARFYLRSSAIREEILKLSQGSTRFNLSKNEIMKLQLIIPPTIKEQRRIASVLSKAEDEIKYLRTQMQSLQQKKKGLMQVLLTGKKRVKI